MNLVTIYILKLLRKINFIILNKAPNTGRNWNMFPMKDYGNNLIYEALTDSEPRMIARIGATEMLCLYNFLGIKNKTFHKRFRSYIKGESPSWWWDKSNFKQLSEWSGFFPSDKLHVEHFCELMISDMPECDILGSWLYEERFFKIELSKSKKIMLEDLEPFFSNNPWTKALENKKILVVHPFSDTIENQYLKRNLLFENNLLPQFELITLKAVQTIANESTPFETWFEALKYMSNQIDNINYDICILGCGAYGFPLAAHVKRKGKKAIHLGGITQLLFGIKGNRWEEYIVYPYANLFNEHWARPSESETPSGATKVEGGCYW